MSFTSFRFPFIVRPQFPSVKEKKSIDVTNDRWKSTLTVQHGYTSPCYCPEGLIVIQEENQRFSCNLMGYAMKAKLLILILVILVALVLAIWRAGPK